MNTPRKYALRALPKDSRDFPHSQVFGSVSQDDLPKEDFLVAVPLEIKNQDINYPTDFCTAYAASSVAEDEDQVVFVPEWTFAQAKGLVAQSGEPDAYTEYGLDLRQICKAVQKKGFLPKNLDPFGCDTLKRPDRDLLVMPENWGKLKDYDSPYKKPSYLVVDGRYDTFDNFRSVMHMNLGERRSIITGCIWRETWSKAVNGVVPKIYEANGTGHALKICGQKTINGEIHLIAQLSDGTEFGDKGYFYFPREVVNKEFSQFGAFTFSNMGKNKALWYVTNGVSVHDSWFKKVWKIISNFISI